MPTLNIIPDAQVTYFYKPPTVSDALHPVVFSAELSNTNKTFHGWAQTLA